MDTYAQLRFEHEIDVTVIIRLQRVTRLQLEALCRHSKEKFVGPALL